MLRKYGHVSLKFEATNPSKSTVWLATLEWTGRPICHLLSQSYMILRRQDEWILVLKVEDVVQTLSDF